VVVYSREEHIVKNYGEITANHVTQCSSANVLRVKTHLECAFTLPPDSDCTVVHDSRFIDFMLGAGDGVLLLCGTSPSVFVQDSLSESAQSVRTIFENDKPYYKSLCHPSADDSRLLQIHSSNSFHSVHFLWCCGNHCHPRLRPNPYQTLPSLGSRANHTCLHPTPAEVVRSLGRNFLRTDPLPNRRELPNTTPHVSLPSFRTVPGSSIDNEPYIRTSIRHL
jgi:hypothetical protein